MAQDTGDSFGIIDTHNSGDNFDILDVMGKEGETVTSAPEDITKNDGDEDKTSKLAAEKEAKDEKVSIDILAALEEEEEEEEEEKTDPKKPDAKKEAAKKEDASEDSELDYNGMALALEKAGILSKLEGDINSGEDLLEQFQREKQNGANEILESFIGRYGEDYAKAFEAIFVHGVNPQEYFTTYNNIVDFSNLDITKEANQVEVIKRMLKEQSLDADDIEAEIERLRNYGDLESVAGRYHKVLLKKEAQTLETKEQESIEQRQQQEAVKSLFYKNVQNVLTDKLKTKDFDGIPVTQGIANDVFDSLTTEKWKTKNGELLTDFDKEILDLKKPENHQLKVKVALLLNLMKKDPELNSLKQKALTTKSNELFAGLARNKNTAPTTSAPKEEEKKTWF